MKNGKRRLTSAQAYRSYGGISHFVNPGDPSILEDRARLRIRREPIPRICLEGMDPTAAGA